MRVVIQHSWRYMTSDSHDRLIASLGLRQLRDGMVAQIMKTEASSWALDLLHVSRAIFVSTRLSRVLKQMGETKDSHQALFNQFVTTHPREFFTTEDASLAVSLVFERAKRNSLKVCDMRGISLEG